MGTATSWPLVTGRGGTGDGCGVGDGSGVDVGNGVGVVKIGAPGMGVSPPGCGTCTCVADSVENTLTSATDAGVPGVGVSNISSDPEAASVGVANSNSPCGGMVSRGSGTNVGEGVGVGNGVCDGSGVFVAVDVAVGVAVGSSVRVRVGVGVSEGVEVMVAVCVMVGVVDAVADSTSVGSGGSVGSCALRVSGTNVGVTVAPGTGVIACGAQAASTTASRVAHIPRTG